MKTFDPGVRQESEIFREQRSGNENGFFRRASIARPSAWRSCGTLPLVGELRRETQVQSGRGFLQWWAGPDTTGMDVNVCRFMG